jgi:hypothetical protein
MMFGEPLDLPPSKGRIDPEYQQTDFVEKISRFDSLLQDSSYQILYDGRNRIHEKNRFRLNRPARTRDSV